MTGILIQLAIAEKKPDEVLKWYDYASRKKGGLGMYDFPVNPTEVAEAIKSAHPGSGDSHLAGSRGEPDRPGAGEWVRGRGSLFAKHEKCAHASQSQARMGSVSGFLARAEQASAAVSGGAEPAGGRTPANYRHVEFLTRRPASMA